MRCVKRTANPPVVDVRLVARRYAAVLTERFSANAYAHSNLGGITSPFR